MPTLTPRDQLDHIEEGGYQFCPDCGGAGVINEPRGCLASYPCDLCGGEGIVFCGEDDNETAEAA